MFDAKISNSPENQLQGNPISIKMADHRQNHPIPNRGLNLLRLPWLRVLHKPEPSFRMVGFLQPHLAYLRAW